MKKIHLFILALAILLLLGGCTGKKCYVCGTHGATYEVAGHNLCRECYEAVINKLGEENSTPEGNDDSMVAPTASTGEKNALGSAKSYLNYSAFSYNGLINQLEYEGYTTAEATYAADHCNADWNEQALKSAQSYLNHGAFSYSGLINQLEYEEYTSEEATYAADHCNADWNEQAAKSAKSYLDYSSFSREELIDQLEYEGFTYDQAVYGVSQNGY